MHVAGLAGAAVHGFRRDDGTALQRWLLDLTRDPDISTWTAGTSTVIPKDGQTFGSILI